MRMFALLQSGVGLIMLLLIAIVHIGFALAIKQDANKIISRKGKLCFASPGLWTFATVLGGVTVVAIYWAIHYSTLNPRVQELKQQISNKEMHPTN